MDQDYLKYIPKGLLEDLRNQKVIPFVGAGFSKNAQIPEGKSMPDWNELGKEIAKDLQGYEYERGMALDAISTYEDMYSRVKLIEKLASLLLVKGVEPGKTHEAFCKLFSGQVCTTNFDSLLEDAYSNNHMPVSVIGSEEKLAINLEKYTKVIKIHGDFDHLDKMVITEKDYDCYIDNNSLMATYISNLFITNTILLIGYSFDDADIRTIWNIINSRLGNIKRTGYCIMVDASISDVMRFSRRNIHVINIPGDKKDYASILARVFEQLKEAIEADNVSTLKASNAKIKENMLIDENDRNRLCYISASYEKMIQIQETIIPLLVEMGYEPAFSNEVLSFGDNVFRKTELLIKRCGIVIIDLSKKNPYIYWEIETANEGNKKIIFIRDSDAEDPIYVKDSVFEYSNLYDRAFIQKIKRQLEIKSERTDLEEAEWLVERGEYRTAVILALRYLEEKLAQRMDGNSNVLFRHNLAEMLRENGYNSAALKKEIEWIVSLRNDIVHRNRSVTIDEAVKVLEFVKKCLSKKS